MITWTRCAEAEKLCGGPCARRVKRGDPLLLLEVGYGDTPEKRTKRKLVRCTACAKASGYGEPPPDLPPLAERVVPPPMVKVAHVGAGALPFDWRARASGEREPGEEG